MQARKGNDADVSNHRAGAPRWKLQGEGGPPSSSAPLLSWGGGGRGGGRSGALACRWSKFERDVSEACSRELLHLGGRAPATKVAVSKLSTRFDKSAAAGTCGGDDNATTAPVAGESGGAAAVEETVPIAAEATPGAEPKSAPGFTAGACHRAPETLPTSFERRGGDGRDVGLDVFAVAF